MELLSTTGGALDNWRYFGQLEVLSTTVGTLDNWECSCSGELLVLQTNGGTFDNCWYSGQLEVVSMTGDPMMLCDHKVQSNPAMLFYISFCQPCNGLQNSGILRGAIPANIQLFFIL